MDGDDDLFQIENMEASESVLTSNRSRKFEKLVGRRNAGLNTTYLHQDTNDDEDNASDADSSIPQNPIRPLPNQKKFSDANMTPNTTTPNPPISTSILKKSPK